MTTQSGLQILPNNTILSVRLDGDLVEYPITIARGVDRIALSGDEIHAIIQRWNEIGSTQAAFRKQIREASFPTEPGVYVRSDRADNLPYAMMCSLSEDGLWTDIRTGRCITRSSVMHQHADSPLLRVMAVGRK